MINIKMPLPEKVSTNKIYDGTHWSKRSGLKNVYQRAMLPYRSKVVKKYPVDITYIFTFVSKPLDTTNCTYMVKLLEDGLVAHGVLKGDSLYYVESTTINVKTGDEDCVEICIAE